MSKVYETDNSSDDNREDSLKEIEIEEYQKSIIEDESPQSYKNPFLNDAFKEKYVNLYEDTKYECRSRFDENFRWTTKAQRKLTWKLDLRVTLVACILFSSLQIDRSNLSQAVSDNMLNDLNMTTNNFNTGNTIFYVCFLAAELPSQLISKRLGSDIWIPIQITCWSIVTICQFKLNGKGSFYACRALLGFMEGGFIPDLILWLSYFYTGAELTIRLSFFWTGMYVTQIVNYLIAYGILHMRGVHGKPGWAWLFFIEGFITLAIGISAFFLMVPSPVQTKKPWEPNGYLSEEEEKIVVNKILRDDPSKGDMHNRQGLTIFMLWNALKDWYLWPMYLIGIVHLIPENTISSYLTLLLKQMGFSTFHVNLLCIPYNALKIINLLAVARVVEWTNSIFYTILIQPVWVITLMGVVRFWSGTLKNHWGTYAVLTVLLGAPYIHAVNVSTCSKNSQSIKTRTVSASLYNMFVQAGSIIGSNIYRTPDKPYYYKGNAALFGIACSILPIILLTKLFYVYLNKKRDAKWNAMSDEEREHYITHTTDRGSSRLDFRFAH
ncbi:hypothetical protein C6P40_000877 [Pichia californica]|uniref:Allantoate permease n=1 Tax=Pichia californica TaxID=460514 RepID=A0A9P6WKF0_9ASCO|nr:hypothetical protein C6P42_004960 [[Candida] californica]KAG0688499.1 hypothetical protein C6P40_000877 [[Candida] californica]